MKRQSNHQISKDDPEVDHIDDEPEIEESKRATEEVISKRRIIKARRPGASAEPTVAPTPQISFSIVPNPIPITTGVKDTLPVAVPAQEKEHHHHHHPHHDHHKHDKDTASSEPEKKNEETTTEEPKAVAPAEAAKEESTKEIPATFTAPKLTFSGFLAKPTSSFGFGSSSVTLNASSTSTSPTLAGSPTASAGGAFLSWASKPVVATTNSTSSSSIFASFGSSVSNNNDEDNEDGDDNGDDAGVNEHNSDAIFAKVVDLPETVELQTGEEDESTLLQLRVKLYRWNRESASSASQEEDHGGVDGVEAVQSNALGNWVEVGVGPLKVLRDKSNDKKSRLVIRREEKIGGSGTKVLLNAALKQYVTVSKHSETVVRINCINHANDGSEVKMNTYNIRTKLSTETSELYDILIKCIETDKE